MASYYIRLVLMNTVALIVLVAAVTALSRALDLGAANLTRVNVQQFSLTIPVRPDFYNDLLDRARGH